MLDRQAAVNISENTSVGAVRVTLTTTSFTGVVGACQVAVSLVGSRGCGCGIATVARGRVSKSIVEACSVALRETLSATVVNRSLPGVGELPAVDDSIEDEHISAETSVIEGTGRSGRTSGVGVRYRRNRCRRRWYRSIKRNQLSETSIGIDGRGCTTTCLERVAGTRSRAETNSGLQIRCGSGVGRIASTALQSSISETILRGSSRTSVDACRVLCHVARGRNEIVSKVASTVLVAIGNRTIRQRNGVVWSNKTPEHAVTFIGGVPTYEGSVSSAWCCAPCRTGISWGRCDTTVARTTNDRGVVSVLGDTEIDADLRAHSSLGSSGGCDCGGESTIEEIVGREASKLLPTADVGIVGRDVLSSVIDRSGNGARINI